MARVKWEDNNEIEIKRIILKDRGFNYRQIAEALTNEFKVNITTDMISGRDRLFKQKQAELAYNLQLNDKLEFEKNAIHEETKKPKIISHQCLNNNSNIFNQTSDASKEVIKENIRKIAHREPKEPSIENVNDFVKILSNVKDNTFESVPDYLVNNYSTSGTQPLFSDEMYKLKEKYVSSEETKKEMKRIWSIFDTNKAKKILCLSDLHAPYMDFKNIDKAISDNSDCSICVLNGDIFDGESLSKFDKMHETDCEEEFEQVYKLLDVLTVRFEHIVWVGGNHDYQRFCSWLIKNIKPGLRKYAFDKLNPMQVISKQYPNVIAINNNLLEIGDVVFKHPNGYSGVEMKTVVNELDIISANKIDLPNPDFKAIIIGHTHDAGFYYKNDFLLMETGCLCYIADYKATNPVRRRWSIAYARIELDNLNKIIFNNTRLLYLESAK